MAVSPPPGIPAPVRTMYSDPAIGSYVREFQVNLDGFVAHLSETYMLRIQELEKKLGDAQTVNKYLQNQVYETENKYNEATRGLNRRVVCLVDGDGSIFSLAQVARGKSGGHDVASQLTEAIRSSEHLAGADPFTIHTWVFFNKAGLSETLRRCGKDHARLNLDEFVHGFNQAAERFMMVDIGHGKEMADAKIRAYLEEEVKAPQTIKVLFAGCHDSGYLTSIRPLITNGYRQKLILMPGYDQMAFGYASLELPVLTAPSLFEHDKLVTSSPVLGSPKISPAVATKTAASSSWATIARPNGAHYSPPQTPGYLRRNSVAANPGPRRIDPNKPLSKQDPPPCNIFYLTEYCRFGDKCSFAHDYLLKPEHQEEMRENAKKSACPAMNRDEICMYGDDCVLGHKCPYGSKCHFAKMGTCKFVGSGMHTAE